jgi:hypothetical protein
MISWTILSDPRLRGVLFSIWGISSTHSEEMCGVVQCLPLFLSSTHFHHVTLLFPVRKASASLEMPQSPTKTGLTLGRTREQLHRARLPAWSVGLRVATWAVTGYHNVPLMRTSWTLWTLMFSLFIDGGAERVSPRIHAGRIDKVVLRIFAHFVVGSLVVLPEATSEGGGSSPTKLRKQLCLSSTFSRSVVPRYSVAESRKCCCR